MLWGICHGTLRLPHGFVGRSLLGYQTLRALGTPPGGSDSLKTRFAPNVSDGDIYITSVWTSNLYRLNLRQDGTYWYVAGGNASRQLILADTFSISLAALNGEGTLAINDQAPRPVNGTLFSGAQWIYGQLLNQQLNATDPEGDSFTYGLQAGTYPSGASLSTSGLVGGTPNAYGSYGFTIRLQDSYGAFTDSVENITVVSFMPEFRGQLIAAAQAQLTTMGLSSSFTPVSSSLPTGTIITQNPLPQTRITSGSTTISFTTSNGGGGGSIPNLFPSTLLGITFNSTREMEWNSTTQQTATGKVSTTAFMQYPIVHWDLNYELLNQNATQDELKAIAALFNQMQAQQGTFWYIDPAFNTVTAEPFGINEAGATLCNGTQKQFQLVATYRAAPGAPGMPEIIQALQAAPTIYDNGVLVAAANYSVGGTGIITFNTAPVAGHALTWSGSFYYNAQFETDDLTPQEFMNRLWSLQSLKIKSVIV